MCLFWIIHKDEMIIWTDKDYSVGYTSNIKNFIVLLVISYYNVWYGNELASEHWSNYIVYSLTLHCYIFEGSKNKEHS